MEKQYNGSMESTRLMTLDKRQVFIICDSDESVHELGTGFQFLKKNWIVTASHVVFEDKLPRQNLYAQFVNSENNIHYAKLKIIAEHIECDIAILEFCNEEKPLLKPLFPGYEDFQSAKGLVYCGYDSSIPGLRIEHVDNFSTIPRLREYEEIVLEFPSTHVTGGFSGGPIFGDGGVVLGIMVNQFSNQNEPEKSFCRAISIKTLMDAIDIELNPKMMKTENL